VVFVSILIEIAQIVENLSQIEEFVNRQSKFPLIRRGMRCVEHDLDLGRIAPASISISNDTEVLIFMDDVVMLV